MLDCLEQGISKLNSGYSFKEQENMPANCCTRVSKVCLNKYKKSKNFPLMLSPLYWWKLKCSVRIFSLLSFLKPVFVFVFLVLLPPRVHLRSNAAAVTVTRVLPTVLPSSRCTLLALESRSSSFLPSIWASAITHLLPQHHSTSFLLLRVKTFSPCFIELYDPAMNDLLTLLLCHPPFSSCIISRVVKTQFVPRVRLRQVCQEWSMLLYWGLLARLSGWRF